MSEAILIVIVKGLVLILFLFGAAAYMTFLERVVLARLQQRVGPNRAGPLGLLQPIADGIKLLCKDSFKPAGADTLTYWLAPFISLMSALFIFAIIPFGGSIHIFGQETTLQIADINAGVFFLLAFSSLAVYGVVLAGYSSNSRYSLLGGLRGTAQMISYEVPMGLSLLTIALVAGSLSLAEIVEQQRNSWYIWTNPLAFLIYFITAFAETNRAPFDLPEAEQELTGGYHTEYAGIKFAAFFLGEYINILAVSAISATLFFGGYLGPFDLPIIWFLLKIAFFVLIFLWVRATMARFRYGDLMSFGWKVLTPLAILNLIITAYFVLV